MYYRLMVQVQLWQYQDMMSDHEFAKKFDLPIIEVIEGGNVQEEAYTGEGAHINSGELDGLDNKEAISKAITLLEAKGAGEKK